MVHVCASMRKAIDDNALEIMASIVILFVVIPGNNVALQNGQRGKYLSMNTWLCARA